MVSLTREWAVLRHDGDQSGEVDDILLREDPYELFVNGQYTFRFNCSPRELEDLAVGHCFVAGQLRVIEELMSVQVDHPRRAISVSIGPSFAEEPRTPATAPRLKLTPAQIASLHGRFMAACPLFTSTGMAHHVAVANLQELLLVREDVSRLNALEKVLGAALRARLDLQPLILMFSGRLSEEMVTRAIKSEATVLLAVGAPSTAAVDLAHKAGVTLVGFMRGERFNVYTHFDRIEGQHSRVTS